MIALDAALFEDLGEEWADRCLQFSVGLLVLRLLIMSGERG